MPAVACGCSRSSTALGAGRSGRRLWTAPPGPVPAYGRMSGRSVRTSRTCSRPGRAVRPTSGGARPCPTCPRPARRACPGPGGSTRGCSSGCCSSCSRSSWAPRSFADADQRVQVWSVTRDLGADTPLTGDDLRATSVSLDDVDRPLPLGVAGPRGTGAHPAGRPRRAAPGVRGGRTATAARSGAIVIEVDRFGVAGLGKGRVVDVYVVPRVAAAASRRRPRSSCCPG